MRKPSSPTKTLAYAVASLTAVAALTACGSGGTTATSGAEATSTTRTPGAAPSGAGAAAGGNGERAFPGASGLIAAIDGKTMQVQSRTEQVAVVWNAKTTITTQIAGSAEDLKVGACVLASPARTTGAASAPATASGMAESVAAATVRIARAVNGACSFGSGGRGGQGGLPGSSGFPGGGQPPSGMPSGVPTDRPSGMLSGGFPGGGAGGLRGGIGAFGTIASVGDGSFTVTSTGFPGANDASASSTTHTVTYDTATIFTTSSPGKTADIKVGECARAMGSADDTGTITATMLSLSPAENGTCTTGFGGPRQGNG